MPTIFDISSQLQRYNNNQCSGYCKYDSTQNNQAYSCSSLNKNTLSTKNKNLCDSIANELNSNIFHDLSMNSTVTTDITNQLSNKMLINQKMLDEQKKQRNYFMDVDDNADIIPSMIMTYKANSSMVLTLVLTIVATSSIFYVFMKFK